MGLARYHVPIRKDLEVGRVQFEEMTTRTLLTTSLISSLTSMVFRHCVTTYETLNLFPLVLEYTLIYTAVLTALAIGF